jgi:hypothetical protein
MKKRSVLVFVCAFAVMIALFIVGCGHVQPLQKSQSQPATMSAPAPVYNEATTPNYIQLIIEKQKGKTVAYVGSSAGLGDDGKVYHSRQIMEFWNPKAQNSDLTEQERKFLIEKKVKFVQNFYRGEGAGSYPGVVWFDLNGPDGSMIRQIYIKWADKYGKSFPKKEGKWINSKTSAAIITAGLTIEGWKATRIGVNGFWWEGSIPER